MEMPGSETRERSALIEKVAEVLHKLIPEELWSEERWVGPGREGRAAIRGWSKEYNSK